MRWFFGFLIAAAFTLPSQLRYNANVTGSVSRPIASKLGDVVSVADFQTCDGVTDNSTAIANAIAAGVATSRRVVIEPNCVGTYTNPLSVPIEDLRTTMTQSKIDTGWYLKRIDNSSPVSGAGILNPYLAPAMRLDLLTQSGNHTGSHTGMLIFMPGIKGKTTTTFTQVVTGSGSPQTVSVVDSACFVVNDVANVDLNQGGAKSEDVTITAISDSTHVTGIFTKNHANGAKLFTLGKGDKIGLGVAMADSASNTNNVFAANFNVTAVAGAPTNSVAGEEIDVTNSTGADPGKFAGDTAPNLTGSGYVCAGSNDCTNAIGITGIVAGHGWKNGIQIEGAVNNGISISNGIGLNPTTGIAIQAAGTTGLAIGSNQTAASNPNFTNADPTTGILLTSRGTSGSISSNTIRWQELVASVSHTWDEQAASSQLRWLYDGTWQGAAVNTDGSIQTQSTFQVRNAANTTVAYFQNQGGFGFISNHTYQSAFANPATTGTFRLVSGEAFNIRNNANSADLNLLSKSAADVVAVGDTAGISTTGKIATYNSIATVGNGVASVHGATAALTAQTANLGATNVYASAPAGEYRVCANARTTTSGTGTTANLNIIWTDEGGVKTDAVGTWALNSVTVTGQINKCEFIHAAAATAIQVSVTAGTYGTSVYAISAQVERLQ